MAVTGELDLATVDQLRNVIAGIRRSNRRRIVVDLREIDFIDLAGLHLLLDLHSDAELDGWGFAIVDGAPSLACLLDATRLSGHFKRAEL